jgi:hypothetical protein
LGIRGAREPVGGRRSRWGVVVGRSHWGVVGWSLGGVIDCDWVVIAVRSWVWPGNRFPPPTLLCFPRVRRAPVCGDRQR